MSRTYTHLVVPRGGGQPKLVIQPNPDCSADVFLRYNRFYGGHQRLEDLRLEERRSSVPKEHDIQQPQETSLAILAPDQVAGSTPGAEEHGAGALVKKVEEEKLQVEPACTTTVQEEPIHGQSRVPRKLRAVAALSGGGETEGTIPRATRICAPVQECIVPGSSSGDGRGAVETVAQLPNLQLPRMGGNGLAACPKNGDTNPSTEQPGDSHMEQSSSPGRAGSPELATSRRNPNPSTAPAAPSRVEARKPPRPKRQATGRLQGELPKRQAVVPRVPQLEASGARADQRPQAVVPRVPQFEAPNTEVEQRLPLVAPRPPFADPNVGPMPLPTKGVLAFKKREPRGAKLLETAPSIYNKFPRYAAGSPCPPLSSQAFSL